MHIQTYENECLGTQHKPMLQFKQGTHTQTVRQTDIVFCVYLCLLSRFACVCVAALNVKYLSVKLSNGKSAYDVTFYGATT